MKAKAVRAIQCRASTNGCEVIPLSVSLYLIRQVYLKAELQEMSGDMFEWTLSNL